MAAAVWFSFAFGAIGLLVPLLLAVVSVRMLWLSLTRPRGAKRTPACERCGYAVSGLTVWRCPECGTDLRATGIITPAMEARRRGGLWGAIIAWTVLVALAGTVVGYAGLMVGLQSTANSVRSGPMATVVTETLTPTSSAMPAVESAVTYVPPAPPSRGESGIMRPNVTLTVTTPRGTSWLSVTSAREWTWSDPLGHVNTETARLDGSHVLIWLSAAGVDRSAAGVAEAAEDLAGHLDAAMDLTAPPTGAVYSGTQFSSSLVAVSARPAVILGGIGMPDEVAVLLLIALVVGAAIWILGIVLIVIRRRRLLREFAGEPVARDFRAAPAAPPTVSGPVG